MNDDFPTVDEIKRWITDAIRHSIHIEYYLERLQVGRSDIQRPHDLIGHGNKLEWPAIRGFSMQYRKEPGIFDNYVKPALDYHRQQYHHLCWNEFNPSASTDSMRLGAVDAVCSLLEPRGYQGGLHTFDDVINIAEKNPIHKVAWMQLMVIEMRKIEKPTIPDIEWHSKDYDCVIPRCGLNIEKHEIIIERFLQTVSMLKQDHGIKVYKDY